MKLQYWIAFTLLYFIQVAHSQTLIAAVDYNIKHNGKVEAAMYMNNIHIL